MTKVQEENDREGRKNGFFPKSFLRKKFSNTFKKKVVKTPTLKGVRQFKSTPKTRSASKSKQQFGKRKRSSIGISSLSKSQISTPKYVKTGKHIRKRISKNTDTPNSKNIHGKHLMPRVLMSQKPIGNVNDPPIIVLDDIDEGVQIDEKTKAPEDSSSPEIEILTVKITPNDTKKVKSPEKCKTKNPQKILSKFNFPNPVFPQDSNFIPLSSGEIKSRRQTRNSTGYRFDPKSKANVNFTPLVDEMAGKVFTFHGSAYPNENKRQPTMGLNQLRASSRSKLQSAISSQVDVAPDAFKNVFVPEEKIPVKQGTLRTIVIDGQNVGVEHAKAKGCLVIQGQGSSGGGAAPKFSAEGVLICVDYFRKRGHKEIIVFVPQFRSKKWQCDKPEILEQLNREGILKYTPCKQIDGRAYNSYDDRFIVQCAALMKGVIISNDNYRDLALEDSKLKGVIDERVLNFVWVGNTLMFSQDPLGKNGPTLDQFLQH